jgi:hypothetical protein
MAPSLEAVASTRVSPDFFAPVRLPTEAPPQLFVIVDTEEEFDWSAGYSRSNVSVTAIDEVGRLQDVLRPYKLKPTYVIDYPVASTPESARRLARFAGKDECHIGAHLHPWVNPPATEPLGPMTSYACNLGGDLERAKISALREAIVANLGVTPRVYKAGRYGFGRTTADTLEALGFDVDVSVNPHMNYESDGGPSFEGFDVGPGFFGARRKLLEVPCTTAFVGAARRLGESLHRAASASWLQPLKAVGVLARTGALNKIMLSPEGSTLEEMVAVTDTLINDGVRTLSITFHSPSLKPGCTPYVRTTAERDAFLKTIDRYCDYFLTTIRGVPGTPADLYDQLSAGPHRGPRTQDQGRHTS